MRNDYKIRPRPGFKMGGKAKKGFPDLNKDGKLDIIVMMAQAYEGIYYFTKLNFFYKISIS